MVNLLVELVPGVRFRFGTTAPRSHGVREDRAVAAHQDRAAIVEVSQTKPSGSVNGSAVPAMAIRCDPDPSGETPATFARARRRYRPSVIGPDPVSNSTYIRLKLFATGRLKEGEAFVHESIIGSTFTGRVARETTVGGKPAIIPTIEGWARVTGYNTIFVDDRDPFWAGFQVVDGEGAGSVPAR